MTEGRYANIIIDISHEKVDRPFQYRIPDSLLGKLETGMCVQVPFGNGNHLRQGYVIEVTDKAGFPEDKMKRIAGVVKGSVSAEADAIRLAVWMRKTYGSTMIAALKTVLPVKRDMKLKEKKRIRRLFTVEETRAVLGEALRKHQSAKARVLEELCRESELPYELVTGKLNVSPATLRSLMMQGVIAVESENYYRNPVKLETAREAGLQLSKEQETVRREILSDYDQGIRGTYLIHGITGSGKTEVYLSLIEGMINRGKQCIVLIPEIALTYQTLLRFYKRFGDRVSVINSTLSAGEKYDQCRRAAEGELDVIIGPRSALFVPFPNLGMIVMDEEHEASYKSETAPKYHARETAEYLAGLKGASLVLGSATPSLEAYYRAREGKYRLFTLNSRLTGGSLAPVSIVDLRKELREGNRSIFSKKLQELIQDRLFKKEQIMLFLNRRGYAGFISCRSCGYVMKCPHCDVSLSQHMGGKLVCHYCGYETGSVSKCPSCASPYISGFKAGTEQIEQQLYKYFPGIRVLRMDGDTTRQKGSYEKILSAFSEGEADVLVGTQMIVKGHDFPNVTLVGVLAADLSLNDNDYRAGERTFQLLTQAAGRAGRGSKPGEALIQTYRPEHYSIVRAAAQDYNAFYEEEILYREIGSYPPASHMLAVLVASPSEETGMKLAEKLAELGKGIDERASIIGPAKASIGKINDVYRFMIYCKSADEDLLIKIRDRMEQFTARMERKKEMVQFDFDPMSSY
ncbi:MAG: primosomal protein N' [Lachnospiraceae bacterium]|nr:primosomal protein N' [Lachnospiraceae bacterium]